MRIQAQLMMVMALDKCLGCQACSVSCKRSWTDRPGSEQAWFNNVETRPGRGYPAGWDDFEAGTPDGDEGTPNTPIRAGMRGGSRPRGLLPRGGWERDDHGRLRLSQEPGPLARIRPTRPVPGSEDYYEPWSYDFAELNNPSLLESPPAAGARSLVTGKPLRPQGGPNWDDDVARVPTPAVSGSSNRGAALHEAGLLQEEILRRYEQMFMFYLPRICNHCLLPSCAAACPSHAIYKRSHDGLVLVDEKRCRGRHSCVPACPYRKVYLNRQSGKAEKCMFCLPGITENGQPTLCADACAGRVRFIGVVLYDADAVLAAAEQPRIANLVEAQRELLLDASDPSVLAQAEQAGIPQSWLEAARHSPVYALAKELRVALPLHPEFRTLPMVWYVPPLSPMLDALQTPGDRHGERQNPDGRDHGVRLPSLGEMRIPIDYLAGLFAAGDASPVEEALRTLVAMRVYMREGWLNDNRNGAAAGESGAETERLEHLFRLLGVGERKDRYVIPRSWPLHD